MRQNFKSLSIIALLSASSLNSFAGFERRAFCEDPRKQVVYQNLEMSQYESMLKENKVSVVNDGITTQELDEFFFEYNKFPLVLRTEMINNFATIHLIRGTSVMDDPTWNQSDMMTFDNRHWSTVVGAGGMPFTNLATLSNYNKMSAYCDNPRVKCASRPVIPEISKPARIVINRMYNEVDTETTAKMNNGQTYYKATNGSVNVLLHEHAHTLDNLYAYKGISASQEWVALTHTPEAREYMSIVCRDKNYCLDNDNEAFAELFAYYHACAASTDHMTRNYPELANFFEGLKEVKTRFNPGVELVTLPGQIQESQPQIEAVPETIEASAEELPQVSVAPVAEVKPARKDPGEILGNITDGAKKAFNGLRSRLFGKKKPKTE